MLSAIEKRMPRWRSNVTNLSLSVRALFYPVERPTTNPRPRWTVSATCSPSGEPSSVVSRTSTQPVPRAPNSRPRSMSCGRSTRRWSSARAVENS